MAYWFTASFNRQGGESQASRVFGSVVLIGLVNRIFHKRTIGLEQFLFSVRRGMCLFETLKGDFCAAWLQQPNGFFCLPALFVFLFLV